MWLDSSTASSRPSVAGAKLVTGVAVVVDFRVVGNLLFSCLFLFWNLVKGVGLGAAFLSVVVAGRVGLVNGFCVLVPGPLLLVAGLGGLDPGLDVLVPGPLAVGLFSGLFLSGLITGLPVRLPLGVVAGVVAGLVVAGEVAGLLCAEVFAGLVFAGVVAGLKVEVLMFPGSVVAGVFVLGEEVVGLVVADLVVPVDWRLQLQC